MKLTSSRRILSAIVILGFVSFGLQGQAAALAIRPVNGSSGLITQVPFTHGANVVFGGERARVIGNLPRSAPLLLTLGLPIRNEAGLDNFIATQATQGHYLTQAEFDREFGAARTQVANVEAWAKDSGFHIDYSSPDGLSITVSTSAAKASQAFHTPIRLYRLAGGRQVYANASAPAVPRSLDLQTVTGLDDAQHAKIAGFHKDDVPGGGYIPSNLRAAYGLTGQGYDGTGQTIGLVLWGSPVPNSDLAAFAKLSGDPKLSSCTSCNGRDKVQWIQLKGKNKDHDLGEQALDVEYAHGMALHSHLKFFLGDDGSNAGIEAALSRAANDPSIHIVSDSWGLGGVHSLKGGFVRQTTNTFKHAVAVGTSFYFSTGDAGANSGCNDPSKHCGLSSYPANSPYVVAVGGTNLQMDPTFKTWQSEQAWSSGSDGSSGGGCTPFIKRPSWQRGVEAATCKGRAVPDISAIGDVVNSPALIFVKGSSQEIGGTSLATPVIAGMAADTDSYLARHHLPLMGFATPKIYAMGRSPEYNAYFHDVLCGTNTFPAGPAWDQVTGWGSPNWLAYTKGFAGEPVDPAPPVSQWSCLTNSGTETDLKAVSCTTRLYCAAVGSSGRVLNTSNGWHWTRPRTKVGKVDFAGVVCLSQKICYAVSTGGRFYQTANGGKTYQSEATSATSATGMSCPKLKTCYVSTSHKGIVKTVDGSHFKDQKNAITAGLVAVRCPGVNTCYALEADGNILKTTDGGTWKPSHHGDTDCCPLLSFGLLGYQTMLCGGHGGDSTEWRLWRRTYN